jgi:hypothetical protein
MWRFSDLRVKPPVVSRHMKGSQAPESIGVIALDEWGDFESQHNLGQDQDAASEDDLPTLEELLRPTLRKEDSIGGPKTLSTSSRRPTSDPFREATALST